MAAEKKDIELKLLKVDLSNFRIGEQETTRDAYHAMIEEEGEDLSNLAEDVITHGLSPAELFIVGVEPENGKEYIVHEGNRRLTALRLLETPELASGTKVYKRFKDLSKRYALNPFKTVSCVIVESKEEALTWIERKHLDLGGRGVAKWGAEATARADAFRGKIRPSKAVIDHLRSKKLLSKELEASLSGKTTNLDRVFQMPYMRSALGVNIEKDGTVTFGSADEKRGNDLLIRMVNEVADRAFTVDIIRSQADRESFIDRFADGSVLAEESAPSGKGGSTSKASKGAEKKKMTKKVASPVDRKTLALKGKEYVIAIKEPRLNELYDEATRINPESFPNSAGALMRVFIELSTDHYLTKLKITIPKPHSDKGRKHWSDIGISLKEKIGYALADLDPTSKDPALKEARKGLSTSDALHSIDSLHDFVHGLKSNPDPKEIKRIWARWHPYLALMFERLAGVKK